MSYIHLYNQDGTLLSNGDGSSPLLIGPLNASINEQSAATKVTIKTEAGFKTFGNTEVSFVGQTSSKWVVSKTADGVYAASLTILDEINSAGLDFYVKASASSDEVPVNDTSVDIQIVTKIQAE